MMTRWLKEPLLHFLVAGALLFVVYSSLDRDGRDGDRVVRITSAEINWLKEVWTRQWQREPTREEFRGLVSDYLRESLMAREAARLGLDQDDLIVRRRLAQKMEFLIRDTAGLAAPAEEELRRLYQGAPERYSTLPAVSFEQMYFRSEAEARTAHDSIRRGQGGVRQDASLLDEQYQLVDHAAVAATFGPDFAERLFAIAPGDWQGPIASGIGFHLVRVSERVPGQLRPFDDVRAELAEDWQAERQAEATQQFFDDLLDRYDVVVDEEFRSLLAPADGVAR